MKNLLNRFRGKYIYYALGAAVLLAGGIFLFGGDKNTVETITVRREDFSSLVSVSGKVNTESIANLGFAASGRIGKIPVKNNQAVREGQVLAQLEISDLLAELRIKEINLKTSDVDLADARENLERVTLQENTKVESAYRTLLSEDLELVPNSTYTAEPPRVSGIYGGAEGIYKVRVVRENPTSPDLNILTFELERTQRLVNEEGPTPLGTKGLYLTFPDSLESYEDTVWYLEIPNKAGASYVANYNAYSEAKKARDVAIKNAEYELTKLATEKNDGLSSAAQAEIDKIRSDIRKNTIYAPFAGVVTNIEREAGETVSANETILTVLNEDTFEIESYVPEVNIALIEVGNTAKVTLDAYGEGVFFDAKVVSIDPAETVRDGVSTYKVKLHFQEKDPRIKSGMTANVSIVVFQKPDAIAVPGGVVYDRDGKKFVQIKTEAGITEREVAVGEASSLGRVEIVSGLEEGEHVVLNPAAGE